MKDLVLKPRHVMKVPALGVFIAPQGVARMFQLHDYTKCVALLPPRVETQLDLFAPAPPPVKQETPVLYPLLLPSVYHSPRHYRIHTQARIRKERVRRCGDTR